MSDDAEWAAGEVRALVPGFRIDDWSRAEIFTDSHYVDQLVKGLEGAGPRQ